MENCTVKINLKKTISRQSESNKEVLLESHDWKWETC